MTFTHGVVIEIVSWRDLHTSSPEFRIDIVIGNNRDFTVCQWQRDRLSDQMAIALILRVNRTALSPSMVSGRVVATNQMSGPIR
jgi:hypothetical protein